MLRPRVEVKDHKCKKSTAKFQADMVKSFYTYASLLLGLVNWPGVTSTPVRKLLETLLFFLPSFVGNGKPRRLESTEQHIFAENNTFCDTSRGH